MHAHEEVRPRVRGGERAVRRGHDPSELAAVFFNLEEQLVDGAAFDEERRSGRFLLRLTRDGKRRDDFHPRVLERVDHLVDSVRLHRPRGVQRRRAGAADGQLAREEAVHRFRLRHLVFVARDRHHRDLAPLRLRLDRLLPLRELDPVVRPRLPGEDEERADRLRERGKTEVRETRVGRKVVRDDDRRAVVRGERHGSGDGETRRVGARDDLAKRERAKRERVVE
eukprot:10367-Pelagococcus_subviridis.AAC.7